MKFISLVNLVAGKEIVTELVADGMSVNNVRKELKRILPSGEGRQQMLADYDRLAEILGPAGASDKAATQLIACLKQHKS